MKLKKADEFDQLTLEYERKDPVEGRDIIAFTRDAADFLESHAWFDTHGRVTKLEESLEKPWREWLRGHMMKTNSVVITEVLYLLHCYWEYGQDLYELLPPMEKMLLHEAVTGKMNALQQMAAESRVPQ